MIIAAIRGNPSNTMKTTFGARQGGPGVPDRRLDERPEIGVIEVGCGLEGHAAHLGAGALEQALGVGQGPVEV